MATIEEAKQSIQQAKQQLKTEEAKTAQARGELIKQKRILQSPSKLVKAGLGYMLAPAGKQARAQALQRVKTGFQQIQQRRQQISQIRKVELPKQEARIRQVESARKSLEQKERDYQIARKYAARNVFPEAESKTIQELYAKIRRGEFSPRAEFMKQRKALKAEGLKPIYVGGELKGFEDVEAGMSYEVEALPEYKDIGSLERLEKAGVVEFGEEVKPVYVKGELKGFEDVRAEISYPVSEAPVYKKVYEKVYEEPVSVVSPRPEPPSWFYPEGFPKELKTFQDISKILPDPFVRYYYEKAELKRKYLQEEKLAREGDFGAAVGFPVGVVSGVLATAVEWPLYALRHPIQTVKGMVMVPKEVYTGELTEKIAPEFATRPAYATGFLLGVTRPGFKAIPEAIEITKAHGKRFPEFTVIPSEWTIGKIPTYKELIQPVLTKAKQEVPSKIKIKSVEISLKGDPTARRSSRIFLKDKRGNYILDESGLESSKVISFGGGLKKGEKPKTGAVRELQQETGLKIKDLKYEGKKVFPEEIFYVFTKTLSDEQVAQLRGVRYVAPSEAKGITGQSARYPYVKDNIRVYELALINWLESGKKIQPTWLYTDTPRGRVYYGTQSRYEIVPGSIREYATGEELLLAHGTAGLPVAQIFFKKKFPVRPARRGEPGAGLFVQPPIGKNLLAEITRLEGYTGRGQTILPKEYSRLPFSIPKLPSPGYVGLSYVLGGIGGKYRLAIKLPFQKRGVLLFKEPLDKPIQATNKALRGIESEFSINIGTEIKTVGKRQVEYIGGQRILLQPAKVQRSQVSSTLKKAEDSVELPTKEMSPSSFGVNVRKETTILVSEKISEKKLSDTINLQEKGTSIIISPEVYPKVTEREGIPKVPETPRIPYKELKPPYKEILTYKLEPPSYPPYAPEIPKFPPKSPTRIISKPQRKKRREITKPAPAFTIFVKRRGKFVPVGTGLPRGRALQFGAERVRKELSRQFKIVEAGITPMKDIKYKPREDIFRPFKVRKGKKVLLEPDRFIQRTKFALATAEEKELIRQAKILKGGAR